MKVHVMTFEEENKNGRTYTKDSFVDDLHGKGVAIEVDNTPTTRVDLKKIVGEATLSVEGTEVYATDITTYNVPANFGVGDLLEEGSLSLAMKLVGTSDEYVENTMTGCEVVSLFCLKTEEKA